MATSLPYQTLLCIGIPMLLSAAKSYGPFVVVFGRTSPSSCSKIDMKETNAGLLQHFYD